MAYIAHPFFKIDLKDGHFARNFKFDSVSLDSFSMYKPINVYDGRVVSSGSSGGSTSSTPPDDVDASMFFASPDYSLNGNFSKYIDGQLVACADQGIFIVEGSQLVSSGIDSLMPIYRLKQNVSLDSAVVKWRYHQAPQSHLTSVVYDSATAGL